MLKLSSQRFHGITDIITHLGVWPTKEGVSLNLYQFLHTFCSDRHAYLNGDHSIGSSDTQTPQVVTYRPRKTVEGISTAQRGHER